MEQKTGITKRPCLRSALIMFDNPIRVPAGSIINVITRTGDLSSYARVVVALGIDLDIWWRTNKLICPTLPTAPAGPTALRLNTILESQTPKWRTYPYRHRQKHRRAANTAYSINIALAARSVASGVGRVTVVATFRAPIAAGLNPGAAAGGQLYMAGSERGRRLEAKVKQARPHCHGTTSKEK